MKKTAAERPSLSLRASDRIVKAARTIGVLPAYRAIALEHFPNPSSTGLWGAPPNQVRRWLRSAKGCK